MHKKEEMLNKLKQKYEPCLVKAPSTSSNQIDPKVLEEIKTEFVNRQKQFVEQKKIN